MARVTDAKQIEAIIAKGKYREHLPFWTRDGESLCGSRSRNQSGKSL